MTRPERPDASPAASVKGLDLEAAMSIRRYVLTCVVLFALALAWNGLVHGVLLRQVDASVQQLRRPDFAAKMWLSLPLTAGIVCLFVWGYGRTAHTGSLREGLGYGVVFALLAGLLVDLNQYLLYPIPGRVALAWFVGGLFEFGLYGIVASQLLALEPVGQ
jgi:hypothetical protein